MAMERRRLAGTGFATTAWQGEENGATWTGSRTNTLKPR
jgi:hypothetical protein